MPAKAIILDGLKKGGSVVYRILFLYPISPVLQVNGKNAVPTPQADLPDSVTRYELLEAADLAALDTGSLGFELTNISKSENDSTQQTKDSLVGSYAASKQRFLSDYSVRYTLMGTELGGG